MSDMLVRLYDLPDHGELVKRLQREGVELRRVLPPEKQVVLDWVRRNFEFGGWPNECEKAMLNTPVSCYIAVEKNQIVGFACHDATCRNLFGPCGVSAACRGRGIGKALLWVALRAMAEQGYAYAIIAWVSSVEFYAKAVNATVIEGSKPGLFRGMLPIPNNTTCTSQQGR